MTAQAKRTSHFRRWGLIGVLLTAIGVIFIHDSSSWGWLESWLVSVNLAAFILSGIDKIKAQRGWVRIPEDVLLGLVLLGGPGGALTAMVLLRHKVSKQSFRNAFWTIVTLQIMVACIWYFAAS